MNKLKLFLCNNIFPFCNTKEVKPNFIITKNGFLENKLELINLTKNERICNNLIRKENLRNLKNKGGIKKYLINWIALSILYSIIIFWLIQPESFMGRLSIVFGNTFFYGITSLMLILYITIDRKNLQ